MEAEVPPVQIKREITLSDRIVAICQGVGGVLDRNLAAHLPDVDAKSRAEAVNSLLSKGKISLFQTQNGVLYKCKQVSNAGGSGGAGGSQPVVKGDVEEKLVYKIIGEAGNKGTWIRDIRIKSSLGQTQLNKVLKSLKSKKLIKEVKSVNSTRKIVYMLFNLEPDSSITGGAWYSDQEFESEYVEVLNQQCYKFLRQKLDQAKKNSQSPLAVRNASYVSSNEVLKYINNLGISKVKLEVKDIEAILDTLIYDGKAEKTVHVDNDNYYRAINALNATAGVMRVPCGGCPQIRNCSTSMTGKSGTIHANNCTYMKEWLAS